MGIPLHLVKPIIAKLIHNVRQGVTDKWIGISFLVMPNPFEIRIGYENDGNCYTVLILEGVSLCYDFPTKTV